MFRITSQLELAKENITNADMLEKSILHVSFLEHYRAATISKKDFK